MNGKSTKLIVAVGCLCAVTASTHAQFFPNTGPGSNAGQPGFPPPAPTSAASTKPTGSAVDFTQPRTFTDNRGQAVTGTVTSLESGGVAVIKMEAGGTIRARVLDLSQDDQKYIREWYTHQILGKGNTVRIEAERQKGEKTESSFTPGNAPGGGGGALPNGLPVPGSMEWTSQNAFYHVKLTNRGALSLEKPRVEYYIYKKGEGEPIATGFMEEPPVIGSGKTYEFDTKPVALLLSAEMKGGGGPMGGDGPKENKDKNKREMKESLSGIWMRVYEGDTMIGEYADPNAIKQNNTWPPASQAGATGQMAGRPPQPPQGGAGGFPSPQGGGQIPGQGQGNGGFGPPPQGGGRGPGQGQGQGQGGQVPPPPGTAGTTQPFGNNAPPLNSGR